MIFLSVEEKQILETQHKRERDSRICDRIKAVLLYSEGWTQLQISQALRIRPETIHDHLEDYRRTQKLKPTNGGSRGDLSETQSSQLIEHLEANTYVKVLGICEFVRNQFCVNFTVSGMTKWLHRNKFSYKLLKAVPCKADPEKQAEFIRKYENLMNSTLDNEPILFIDSVHPTMATKISHGWIRTGINKLISATASRTRINLTGAINLESMEVLTQDYETINGQTTISFLKMIEAQYPKAFAIHVILDQSGYHTSDEVEKFVKKSRIKLHFLPPYSPNLNPIERLWKIMNEFVRNNRVFQTVKEFRKALKEFFRVTWKEIAHTMVDRITDNFEIVKQASSS
jgi:transposase